MTAKIAPQPQNALQGPLPKIGRDVPRAEPFPSTPHPDPMVQDHGPLNTDWRASQNTMRQFAQVQDWFRADAGLAPNPVASPTQNVRSVASQVAAVASQSALQAPPS